MQLKLLFMFMCLLEMLAGLTIYVKKSFLFSLFDILWGKLF